MSVRCCTQLREGSKPESVTTAFETSVLMLFVAVFAVTGSLMVAEPLIRTATGVLLSLIAMVKIRSGNARVDAQVQAQQKDKFLLVGLPAGLWAVLFSAVAPPQKGLDFPIPHGTMEETAQKEAPYAA